MVILARCGIVLVRFRSLMLAMNVVMGCGADLAVHNYCTMILANLYSLWVPITDCMLVPCLLGVKNLKLQGFKV